MEAVYVWQSTTNTICSNDNSNKTRIHLFFPTCYLNPGTIPSPLPPTFTVDNLTKGYTMMIQFDIINNGDSTLLLILQAIDTDANPSIFYSDDTSGTICKQLGQYQLIKAPTCNGETGIYGHTAYLTTFYWDHSDPWFTSVKNYRLDCTVQCKNINLSTPIGANVLALISSPI